MIIIGNVFLGLAALVAILLFNMMYLSTVPRGGDAVVGYAWSLIIGILVFSVSLAIVTAIIAWKGHFAWVGASSGLIIIGFLLVMLGNGFFLLGEGVGDLPVPIRQVFKYLPAVLPVMLVLAAGVLLHTEPGAVPAALYKGPIYVGLVLGILALLFIAVHYIRNDMAVIKSQQAFEDKIHQDHLNQIDTTDVSKDAVFLYVFTDANHAPDVRERALAKLKSRPDWQEELVRRLQNDWAPQAFIFLASNEVEDKSLFVEPIRQGILIQAKLIREDIRNCRGDYDLYSDRFSWEIERLLRTVDKFQNIGANYKSEVQALRAALDEPTTFEKPRLRAVSLLDKWLKQRH
ncbi:MAG TPA: hypothetical protein PKA00_08920 [Saprospiraceae bacterium]|nr:hypothetical protein [Saprospiraceae bacterium]HMQ83017.1 hypothetical protein [Saprospiraceae bacterium]